MPTLKKTRGKHLMALLAMCGLVATALGIITNTAGIFFGPIARDLGLGDNITAVSLTLTINNLVFALAGMLVARVITPCGYRRMVALFIAGSVGSTAALAFCHSLISLYAFSLVRGFAAGMIGNVLATMVIGEWFQSDKGLINSLVLGGSGIVGALFNPVLELVIQAAGWRAAYLVAAGVMLALDLPAVLLPIGMRPEDVGERALCVQGNGGADAPAARRGAYSDSAAVLLLAVGVTSIASFVVATPQLFKSIAGSYGLEQTGVAMMSAVLVVNTGGKMLLGTLIDRLGVKRSLMIYGAAIIVGFLLLLLAHFSAAMLLSAALIGLGYSLPTVGAVMICRELFSPERYSKVFPKVNLGTSVANALGYPLLSAIHGVTGSYDAALILAAALMLVSMVAALVMYRLADRGVG